MTPLTLYLGVDTAGKDFLINIKESKPALFVDAA
jgi:hypothetical protein